MVEKFNDYLIIHYPKNRYTNIHKRIINKIYHNRYEVETYYKDKKIIKYFKSDIIYNGEQIEKLCDTVEDVIKSIGDLYNENK